MQLVQKIKQYLRYLKNHLLNYLHKANKQKVVLAVSCGIDSVLTLKLLTLFLPNNFIEAFFIDIDSKLDKQYLEVVREYFKEIEIKELNLYNEFVMLKNSFNASNESSLNIKSKLRSMFVYDFAFKSNALVVSTLNYDEYYLGYFTKFGDANGDIFLINGLTKTDIYLFAEYLGLPQDIITRKPTHGLNEVSFDEQDFNFSYTDLDNYLNFKEVDVKIIEEIKKYKSKNEHKKKWLKPFLLKKFRNYRG